MCSRILLLLVKISEIYAGAIKREYSHLTKISEYSLMMGEILLSLLQSEIFLLILFKRMHPRQHSSKYLLENGAILKSFTIFASR